MSKSDSMLTAAVSDLKKLHLSALKTAAKFLLRSIIKLYFGGIFEKCSVGSGRNPASSPKFTRSGITFVQVEVDVKFLQILNDLSLG